LPQIQLAIIFKQP